MIPIIESVAKGISFCSLAIIFYGSLGGLVSFIRNELSKKPTEGIRRIRATFGGYLLLGLEFLIAADIMITVIEPSYQELVILAGVVVLRVILSVFLNKEIKEIEQSSSSH